MWTRSLGKGLAYAAGGAMTLFAAHSNAREEAEFRKKYPNTAIPKKLIYISGAGMASINDYPTDKEAARLEALALQRQGESTNQPKR
jgi:hypothetical protein